MWKSKSEMLLFSPLFLKEELHFFPSLHLTVDRGAVHHPSTVGC